MRKNQILKLEFTPSVRKSGRRLAAGQGTSKAGQAGSQEMKFQLLRFARYFSMQKNELE